MGSNYQTRYFEKLNFSKITGFSLAEKMNKNETIRLWLMPFIMYLYFTLTFLKKWSLTDDIDDYLYTMGLANVVPRMIIIRINRTRLANIVAMLKDFNNFDNRHEKELKAYIEGIVNKVGVVLSQLGFWAIVAGTVGWCFSKKDGTLPFGSMPSWATEYNFTLCVAFQIVLMAIAAQDFFMADAIKWHILLQLRKHFQFLKSSIKSDLGVVKKERFQPNTSNQQTDERVTIPWNDLKKYIRNITSRHDLLCSIANATDVVFNKCVLVNFLNLSCMYSIILYRMSKIPLFNAEFCKLLFYIALLFLVFCGDTYLCQQVVTESEGLMLSFYEADFVGADRKFQKALVFLMTRAQKSVVFTIGNFAPLSMGTIVTVFNASISYFMLLHNFRGE